MKYKLITLLFVLGVSNLLFTQNNSEEISFEIIERVPIYKGCNSKWSNKELRKCMSDKITKHVLKNFNQKFINYIGLPAGKIKVYSTFRINKKGRVSNITTKAPHKKLEEEANRVISLIPKLKEPGFQDGKPVTVQYTLPLVFIVSETKSSN